MPVDSLLIPGASSTQRSVDASTFVERVKAEIHRDRQVDEDAILRSMCSALEWYKAVRFWFNEGSFTMRTKIGQAEYRRIGEPGVTENYGIPADLLRLDHLRIQVNSTNYRLDRKPYQYLRDIDSAVNVSGYPDSWGMRQDRLLLYPAPNQDDLVLLGDYVKDLGTPTCEYSSGEWVLKDETGSIVGLTWTNPFLKYAEELIRHRVKADLYANLLIDLERANACRQQEMEALDHLAGRTDWILDPGDAQPWY